MVAVEHSSGVVPVVGYPRTPGTPPVTVLRWRTAIGDLPRHGAHAHDFLVLLYVEAGDGLLDVDGRRWSLSCGDAVVIAPRAVVTPGPTGSADAMDAWVVFFPSDAVDPHDPGALASWRTHPLLFPFARGRGTGARRLQVPPPDRATWSGYLTALQDELDAQQDGYAEAVRALLTLLLVRLARLGPDVASDLRDEPVLAAVFDVIESRYPESISLRDVAAAVGLTPGHLTTLVGRRTGRTVQQWIIERRMREARHLLAATDLSVEALAARVGYHDAGYFIKQFGRGHHVTPAEWRRAGERQRRTSRSG